METKRYLVVASFLDRADMTAQHVVFEVDAPARFEALIGARDALADEAWVRENLDCDADALLERGVDAIEVIAPSDIDHLPVSPVAASKDIESGAPLIDYGADDSGNHQPGISGTQDE